MISAAALAVTLASMFYGVAIAAGGSTAQGAAFAVTGISILIGVTVGFVVAVVADAGMRRTAFRWTGANFVVGLACAAIELWAAIGNM